MNTPFGTHHSAQTEGRYMPIFEKKYNQVGGYFWLEMGGTPDGIKSLGYLIIQIITQTHNSHNLFDLIGSSCFEMPQKMF